MKNILELSENEILNLRDPHEVFDRDNLISLGRKASQKWHPDRNKSPLADKVFAHIRKMMESFSEKNILLLNFTTDGGREYNYRYFLKLEFDLGEIYLAKNYILLKLKENNEDLAKNFIERIQGIRYENDEFKKQFSLYLPNVSLSEKTTIGNVIVIQNSNQMVRLSDLVNHFDGQIPERHAAWIINSLYNFVVFAHRKQDFALIGLSSDNIFVDVKNHLASPWLSFFFSAKKGEKMKAMPNETMSLLKRFVPTDKKASVEMDLRMMRFIAIYVLGGNDFTTVPLRKKKVSAPLISFLSSSVGTDVLTEYRNWGSSVDSSFGKRIFLPLDTTFYKVYNSIN